MRLKGRYCAVVYFEPRRYRGGRRDDVIYARRSTETKIIHRAGRFISGLPTCYHKMSILRGRAWWSSRLRSIYSQAPRDCRT